jgi:hypothetical protein
MTRARLATIVGATVIASALAVSLMVGTGLASGSGDPTTAPIPQYDYADNAKSFVVLVDLSTNPPAITRVSVGKQRADARAGDPPLLRLRLLDEKGMIRSVRNSWDPRWRFEQGPLGKERVRLVPGMADFTIPFDADAEAMVVQDRRAGTDLVTIDLATAIRQYCISNPTDSDCLQADLAVLSTATTGPDFAVMGEPVTVETSTVVTNLGPDSPVDGVVTQVVTSTPGLTVAPAQRVIAVDGLSVAAPQTAIGSFELTCLAPGLQSMTVTSTIAATKAKVVDANKANDTLATTHDVDCAVPVTVNVKPGSVRNPIELNEVGIPVAVLTTAEGEYGNPLAFDALSIRASTVRMGPRTALLSTGVGAPESHRRIHPENVYELDETTQDGDLDAMLHGNGRAMPTALGMDQICVRGRFGPGAGTSFFGCDVAEIVP